MCVCVCVCVCACVCVCVCAHTFVEKVDHLLDSPLIADPATLVEVVSKAQQHVRLDAVQ